MPCFRDFRNSRYAKPRGKTRFKRKKKALGDPSLTKEIKRRIGELRNKNKPRKSNIIPCNEINRNISYSEYLQTNYWYNIKQAVYKRHNVFAFCLIKHGLNVHHARYTRHGKTYMFNENLDNLFMLCRNCHKIWHSLQNPPILKPKFIARIRKMIEVLKYTPAQAIKNCCNKTIIMPANT